MLGMKVSLLKEEPPRLFMSLLVMRRTRGVVKPSPTAPINPNPISTQSTPSACMNIDLMLLKLFIVFFPVSFPSNSPIFSFVPKREREKERPKRQEVLYSCSNIKSGYLYFLVFFGDSFFAKFLSHFIDPMRQSKAIYRSRERERERKANFGCVNLKYSIKSCF